MKIDVTGASTAFSQAQRAMAVRRVLLALSRFGTQVQKVTVRLTEPANALGGVDQRCRMRASLQANDAVRSEAINGRVESAVGRAALRLAKGVAWALDGGVDSGRQSPPSGSTLVEQRLKRRSAGLAARRSSPRRRKPRRP